MLHKVGVEDNISYYQDGKGKKDFIINVIWQSDFTEKFLNYLSG